MSSQIDLSVEETPDRLDRYLADRVTDLSRSRLQKLIEQGHVQVNGEVCTSKKLEVKLGDRIQIDIPAAQPLELQAENIPLDILYEDDSLLILNKPAGLVVHPSAGHEAGTMVNALLAHCPTLPGINGVQRPGIVHRLDKDTTGAIAVAKTEQAFHHLQEQFRTKTARRDYLAIVYGAPPQEKGTIDQPIGRHPVERQKMAVVPEEKGRRAITHWHVKERLGNFTLMEFELETGRTHQIRVHSAFMGHPIVGDQVYGSGRKSVNVNLPGQALHAWRLRLRHPLTEEWVVAIAPLPSTFKKLLEVLKRRL
ncbi:RluA family pseudouridine synthase [Phormidesmis priestleyi ULC007]|uniref:Pseudouridine synthase n=1 Tax=Phormidesmis priestleyi ULC007 TaxID=1920490 RepID=A0A2T1DKU3_9CYAN|nr:RluA family pseudouridine synthase [Phormidesmis priestleyi]PSB21128.1 RluA family pseudouridine synthase [Phormidesmis priestleyi ULC007]PZO51347.1 MAG: RluA family pseudouridine synthase [Phormidesmis priestleyi]